MAAIKTRDKMLDVAESLFADRGFHGVSIREIAEAAGVRQSLVHYHFANKETLYAAVYERRSLPINHRRSTMLREIVEGAASDRPKLGDVVSALVGPAVLSSRDRTSGGAFYARLITQLINDPQEHALRISRTYNDPVARQTLDALSKAVPEVNDVALTWGYLFAIGAMTTALDATGRAKRLNAACNPKDVEATLEFLKTFVEGGIQALCQKGQIGEATPPAASRRKRINKTRASRLHAAVVSSQDRN
jgi:AcrR family transcriptional regulator